MVVKFFTYFYEPRRLPVLADDRLGWVLGRVLLVDAPHIGQARRDADRTP